MERGERERSKIENVYNGKVQKKEQEQKRSLWRRHSQPMKYKKAKKITSTRKLRDELQSME